MESFLIYCIGALSGAALVWHMKKEKSNWIPVEERQPKCPFDVEVTLENGTVDIGYYCLWTWRRASNGEKISVMAWKEAPKPYKESED